MVVQRSKAGGSASVGAAVVVVVDAVPNDVEGTTLIGGIDVARSADVDVLDAGSPPHPASATKPRATTKLLACGIVLITCEGYPAVVNSPAGEAT